MPKPIRPYPPAPIPGILLGGSVNLFAGAPNVGKTAFISTFLKQLRDGAQIFGVQTVPPAKIGVLSIDRSWTQSSSLWYQLAGWPDIPHYCVQDDLDFNIDKLGARSKRMEILKACLEKLDPLPFGSLVVIDPIAPFLGGNLLDYDACMVACTRLRRICRERGITMLGIAHSSKQKNDKQQQYRRLQDRIVGSTAQFGYTDTQFYLASPEETASPHYTFLWNPHHSPAETFPLGRAKNGLFCAWGEGAVEQETSEVVKHITEAPEGVGFGELIVLSGQTRMTVWRVLQEGMREGTIERVGHGKYRKLPVN